jgi:phosphoribosylformylglycinamidine synthase
MGKACRKFDAPVTGGNVSFYNQSTSGNAVYPTPTIGMVGVIQDESHIMTLDFKESGDKIVLIGKQTDDIGSSQYLAKYLNVEYSTCPYFDLDEEYKVQEFIKSAIRNGLLQSAHDLSEGGLYVACLESAMSRNAGFSITKNNQLRNDAWLFGESQGRVLVSVKPSKLQDLLALAEKNGIPADELGIVTEGGIRINNIGFGDTGTFKNTYQNAIRNKMEA